MISMRHFGITVCDLDRSLEFYESLGFRVEKRMLESGECIDSFSGRDGIEVTTAKLKDPNNSDVMLELLEYHSHKDPEPETNLSRPIFKVGCSHFAVTVSDLDNVYSQLSEKGTVFNCEPVLSPDGNVKLTFCRDPDGNLIEMVQPLNV